MTNIKIEQNFLDSFYNFFSKYPIYDKKISDNQVFLSEDFLVFPKNLLFEANNERDFYFFKLDGGIFGLLKINNVLTLRKMPHSFLFKLFSNIGLYEKFPYFTVEYKRGDAFSFFASNAQGNIMFNEAYTLDKWNLMANPLDFDAKNKLLGHKVYTMKDIKERVKIFNEGYDFNSEMRE